MIEFIVQNFSTIIQILLASSAALSFFYALRRDINSLRSDISNIKDNQKSLAEAFTQLGNILTKVAVQDARLQMLEKKIEELSHGQGFVDIKRN